MNNNKEDDPRIPGHARNTLRVRQKSNTELKSKLKKKISKIAKCSSSLAYGVYQKLKDTIQKPKQKDKKFRELTSSKEDFPDKDFFLNETLLEPLKRKDMTYISRYSIHKYFQNKEFEIFKNVSIDGQVLRDRRCSYVIDTLNTLSTQPGLLMRLFEDLEVNEKGVYQIWLNINGAWEQVLIDDSVPVFGNSAGKAQFLHLSPNIYPENNEIWMILLFKALAKVYGGYQNLYLGNQNYLLKDLTGAPVTVDNIVYIHEKQKLTEREFQHMDNLWKDMTKALKKGYPAAVSPRPPTEHEIARNQFLNVQSKKFYLDNGIYFGHSYAVVTAKEVKNQAGEMVKLVKLRNPWINEKWTGEWSNNSEEWNDELREVLNYPKLEKEGNEFWMPLRNLMHYFEDFIVCKAKPDSVYSNCQISYPDKNFLRAVVRLSVKEKGKYCISIDQKDPTFLGSRETKNLPVKLSLCKLENDQFKLLSYTSSNSLRNTFIRKLIDKGEYFLLVEQNSLGLDREKLTQENEDLWREVNITTYGPKSCGIKVVECEEIHIIHDFLLYESWKSYAEERIGRRVSSFNLTFDDGNQGSLSIYMLNVPNTVVYVFKNDNDYGVDINTEMIGIENLEVVGPEGKVGFNQHFKIDSGQRDIFILRQTEKILKISENNKQKFQVKSIVGARYFGNKAKSNNQCKVYDFMYYDIPYCVNCNIEKFPELKMFQLFDEKGKTIDLCYEDMEIRVKKKSIVQAPRANSKAMIKDISKSQDNRGKSLEAKPPKPKKKKKKIKEEKVEQKSEKKKSKEEKVDKENEKKKSFIKEEIFKEELKETRKLDEPEKIEKLDSKMVSEMMIERSQNQIQDDDKVQKKKEMKKKPRRSSDLFKIKRDDMKKSKKMEEESKQKSKGKKNIDLAKFLGMNKEEILTQNNEEVLHLLNYTGIDAFCSIYKANQAYLDRLYLKLESGSNKNEKTPKPKNIDESDYNLVSTVNYTLKNNSGGLNFDSYSREKYRQKNENEGELNKSKNPPVFFYTESFRENRKSMKKGKSKKIRSLKNPKKEVKKKLFHDEKKQDNSTDDVFKGPTKNFMNAFSKTRNIFKNKNPGKKLNRNSYQAKLGKIEIQEQKLKESLVKSHLNRANQDEVQATPPIQKKKARKSAYELKRNSPRAYSNNILSKLRKDYIPAKNTPMKPAYDNPKKNQLNKPNRSVSPIFMQKKKISDLNFFGSPQEKKNEIQGLRSNVISSNRENNFFSGREENGNSSTSVIQRRTNHERGQSNVSKSRKYNRYSLDRMTNLTQNYISSKAKKSYGDMSISSRKRQSLNPAESSPPYKLLRTNKLNISKESSSLLSTVTKRPRITKFQEIQKKFLTKVANEVMCNSTNFSRSNGKIMNNWNFEGRIERGVYLKKESILDSEIQDIDNGGAIVDLKLVQPSVNSSSRNIGIFNDKMYFSTQENLFDSHRKMKNQNFGALNLGISNKDHSSIDRLHLNRDSNRRKNEKIVQSKVFSFREKNQNFENHYISVSRNHSRDIAAKKSIPVLQLRRLTKDRRNSAARSNELNIPYEGSAMGSCCSKENASSVFMQRPREYRSTFERKNPEIQKSYERVQRQNRNYLIQSGVSKPLSLVNRQRNFGTGDSLGVSRVKNSQVIDDVNFDLGKNFGNFSVCREVKQAPLKVKDNNVMSVLQRPFGRRKSRTKRTQNSISKRSFDSVQGSRENVMVGVQNFMDKNNRNFNSNLPKSRRKKEDSLLSQGFKPKNRRNLGGLKFYQPERNVNGRGVLSRNRRSYNF